MPNPHHQHARLSLGPAPGSQQPTFQHPPHFGFQLYSYPGGFPVPGIADQYHITGLGMNVPPYPQPYGTVPQQWGYGHNAAGGFPPGGFPNAGDGILNLGEFPNVGGIPNPGGMANVNMAIIPNPALQPIADRPAAQATAQAAVTRMVNQTGGGVPSAATPIRTYPNKQIRKGGTSHQLRHELTTDIPEVWLFNIAVLEPKVTWKFTEVTDADWEDF
jgi:hypothetical protein